MPRKKPASKAITITPEMHSRACQHLADCLLELANKTGDGCVRMASSRVRFGMPPNAQHEIGEVEAQMALWLAREIASGRLVPRTNA